MHVHWSYFMHTTINIKYISLTLQVYNYPSLERLTIEDKLRIILYAFVDILSSCTQSYCLFKYKEHVHRVLNPFLVSFDLN